MSIVPDRLFAACAALVVLAACSDSPQPPAGRFDFVRKEGVALPSFSADSAYAHIAAQVAFGPRVPNSAAHTATRDWYVQVLSRHAGAANVHVQSFTAEGYGERLNLSNVIASFNPEAEERILLAAHWDTRPRADQDPDPLKATRPILGADDGGSATGVLLELARIFSENPPPVGIDIILLDGEDYGEEGDLDRYFLGSRHWSKNPVIPVPMSKPHRFGILLDMVGHPDAIFPMEGFSVSYARPLVNEIWSLAASMGHADRFLAREGPAVADDHMILNQEAGLPTIDIIHYVPENGGMRFGPHWHTHADNMDAISKETLQVVGDVMVAFLYTRF